MLLGARQFFERRGAPMPPLPYDAEVEYIGVGSTTGPYINTGYSATTNKGRIESKYNFQTFVSSNTIWGAQTTADSRWIANQWNDLWWIGNTGSLFSGSNNAGDHIVDIAWDNGTADATINGTLYTSPYNGTVVSGVNVYLFAVNSGHGVAQRLNPGIKLYYWRLWDNGVLVRDMIPVRFTNESNQSECAMYDRVSGALFRNAGTGAFTIGPDKS